ncbi:MAG TPA: phosphoketolase, partial [Erwinia persicina]|nr:phosphoketolase [Erwinia persicina]
HAFGAAFDHPELIVPCIIGDGEAETGPLSASWQSLKFLNPQRDGAVLPILHVNGYKIANPTLSGRTSDEELVHLYRAMGYAPRVVTGSDPALMHTQMAMVLDQA